MRSNKPSNKPRKKGANVGAKKGVKHRAGLGTGMNMGIVRAKEVRAALKMISPQQALQPSAVDEMRGALNIGASKMLKCFIKAKKVKYDPKTKLYRRLTEHDVAETLDKCFRK